MPARPIGSDPIVQQFIRVATHERSALKRHLHRKGVEGYDRDVPRVLSHFILSSARAAAASYHVPTMLELASRKGIPGDVKTESLSAGRLRAQPDRGSRAHAWPALHAIPGRLDRLGGGEPDAADDDDGAVSVAVHALRESGGACGARVQGSGEGHQPRAPDRHARRAPGSTRHWRPR